MEVSSLTRGGKSLLSQYQPLLFAYESHMPLPDRVKIWLTSVNPFLPKFYPNVTHPFVDLSVGDIRSQIAAEWLEIAQWSQ